MATASPASSNGTSGSHDLDAAFRAATEKLRSCPETRARLKKTITRAAEQHVAAPATARLVERPEVPKWRAPFGALGFLLLVVLAVLLCAVHGCSLGPAVVEDVHELREAFGKYERATMPRPPATDVGVAVLRSSVYANLGKLEAAAGE
jgi:hypothetical protein